MVIQGYLISENTDLLEIESQIQKVRSYISNQEEHHKQKSWEEEYNEFITSYGFERLQG